MSGTDIIKPLHGLRGIAALTVVIGHFAPGGTPALGVVLFFVLSGFLIGKLYLEQEFSTRNVWRYVVARVARVYPLFACVVISTAALNLVTHANIFRLAPEDTALHLALAGSAATIWTISTEFQFYALFVPIWALRTRIPRALAAILPLLLLATVLALLVGTAAGRIGVYGYLHIFLVGVLVAVLTRQISDIWTTGVAYAVPLLGAAYLVAFFVIPSLYTPRWVYLDLTAVAICAGLVAATILGKDCLANRMLGRPIFMWLGEISFGVYLLHRHAEWFVDRLLHAPWWLTLVPKVALTLIAAQIVNRLIERPCRSWLRNAGELAYNRSPRSMKG